MTCIPICIDIGVIYSNNIMSMIGCYIQPKLINASTSTKVELTKLTTPRSTEVYHVMLWIWIWKKQNIISMWFLARTKCGPVVRLFTFVLDLSLQFGKLFAICIWHDVLHKVAITRQNIPRLPLQQEWCDSDMRWGVIVRFLRVKFGYSARLRRYGGWASDLPWGVVVRFGSSAAMLWWIWRDRAV